MLRRMMSSLRSPRWSTRRRPRREKPTHFVGFRVTSPGLVAHVEGLQKCILDQHPEAATCSIDPSTLHVTLCVLRLPDDAAIDRACQVLHSEAARVAAREFAGNSPPRFDFDGWGFFGNSAVLYAKMNTESEDGQRLLAVAEHLHGEFDQQGLTTEPFRRPFTPHLTVWKTSRDAKLIKSINTNRTPGTPTVQETINHLVSTYARLQTGVRLGSEHPISIELLQMKGRAEDGYYQEVASAPWCSG